MQELNKQSSVNSGVSLVTVLVIVFTTLKLTNNINWSWWWVFSPYWLPIVIVFSILFIIGFIGVIYLAHTGKSMDEFIKKYTKK